MSLKIFARTSCELPPVREPGSAQMVLAPKGLAKPDAYSRLRPQKRVLRRDETLRAAFDGISAPTVKADVRLLESNKEAWTAVWHLMNQPGPVDASYFIVERDIFGFAFLGGLLKKAKAGEPVRLLVDAIGEIGASGFARKIHGQEYLQELARGGVDAHVHHPIYKKLLHAPMRLLRAWLTGKPAYSLIGNDHQKMLRNKNMAISGGRNISKDYFTAPEDQHDVFHDTDLLAVGEQVSAEMEKAFFEEFSDRGMHHVIRVDGFGDRRRREVELLGAFEMMNEWMKTPRSEAEQERLRNEPAFRAPIANGLVARALGSLKEQGIEGTDEPAAKERLLDMAWALCGNPALAGALIGYSPEHEVHRQVDVKVIAKTSAANRRPSNAFEEALSALIKGTQRKLVARSAYLVLSHNIIEGLKEAGERRVKIEILTNGIQSTDSTWTQADFIENWPGLLAAVPNLRLFVLTSVQKLHCKDAVADEVICVVGSYNLDITSEGPNAELDTMTWSKRLAAEMDQSYRADVDPGARRCVEYTIKRDEDGQAVFEGGRPVVTYGAKDHVSPEQWRKYQKTRRIVRLIRKIPFVSALRHPALSIKE